MAKQTTRNMAYSRLKQPEIDILNEIMRIEMLSKSAAIRHIIRFTAKAYGIFPTNDCPDCSCSTTDHISGQNLKCENCGTHFCKGEN
jgi:hypothetical protein